MPRNDRPRDTDKDRQLVEAATREAKAQLDIVRILGKLDQAGRERVMTAAGHLIAADAVLPGLLDYFIAKPRADEKQFLEE